MPNTGKQMVLGRFLVALLAVACSMAGIFTKGVEAGVWTVLLWRGLLAAGFMSAYLAWRRGPAGLADWKRPGRSRPPAARRPSASSRGSSTPPSPTWPSSMPPRPSPQQSSPGFGCGRRPASPRWSTPLVPLWGWLILSEIPRVATVAGGTIVLVTLVRHLGRDVRVEPSER